MELMHINMGVIRKIWNVMGYYSIPPPKEKQTQFHGPKYVYINPVLHQWFLGSV